ncbi:transmembrane protein 206-like [Scleropages formosus]|uniref:Proton-activated chloride channel n=1 Tax=Scleropages formosus TaxID=113540 RepID=A0A0P7VSC7_SCLFO|nr:transmembrane protein 206 [Scleropages formosus]KPP79374.1 transmembrane protein 206-like [Scleropages formosus]
MLKRENCPSYREFSDDDTVHSPAVHPEDSEDKLDPDQSIGRGAENDTTSNNLSLGFNKACLKNVFAILLIFIYLVLTAVALLLAYLTITDFRDKLSHPVMSVTFKEVDLFEAAGIALYPGKAKLLSCKHHHHDHIPPLVLPGKPGENNCMIEEVIYTDPYSNLTRQAMVIQGPTDVRNRELVFLQFSQNETEEDFSSISYMLFYKFSDMTHSLHKAEFMKDCERNYSMGTFSGGFRTWVKMSLIKTYGKERESVEFRQEASVVKYNDKRQEPEKTDELFFIVFQWRDPFFQEVRDVITANPWNTIAILCGVFMALFKVANFAKLTIQWTRRIRRAHLKRKGKEMASVT